MSPPREDDWLDAFSPEELDDPELGEWDASVQAIVHALEVAEPESGARSGPGWMRVGAIAAAAVLLVGVGVGLTLAMRSRTTAPHPVPPEAVEVAANGLLAAADTELHIEAGRAELTEGLLTYVHKPGYEPGVEVVTWSRLPVVARPIGTVFTAAALGEAGAVRVSEGRVAIERPDGTRLLVLEPDEELVMAVVDEELTWVRTRGLATDEVAASLPEELRPAAVSMIVRMRLSAKSPLEETR